jgi:hypothetical protein
MGLKTGTPRVHSCEALFLAISGETQSLPKKLRERSEAWSAYKDLHGATAVLPDKDTSRAGRGAFALSQ